MSDRDEWLALTTEEALEPDLAICDPHHHFWEHPGSRYLLEEFRQDLAGGHNVVGTLYVECQQKYYEDGPEALRPVGETRFVAELTERASDGIARGIVGFADLTLGAQVREVLEAHLEASERFCGVRHATAWHASEKIHNAHTKPGEGLLLDGRFREGFSVLADMGLTFDAWVYHPQIPELIDLANAYPGASIILNHMAGPLGIGPFAENRDDVFREWNEQISALARSGNVAIKLGGRTLTMAGFGWHKRKKPPGSIELAEMTGPYFRACIDAFGADRCMFESNFPVDKASCSYTVLWNAFKRVSADYSKSERASLFHDTACGVYALEGS